MLLLSWLNFLLPTSSLTAAHMLLTVAGVYKAKIASFLRPQRLCRAAMEGELEPVIAETELGAAEVRAVFGTGTRRAAGCMVTEGTLRQDCVVKVRQLLCCHCLAQISKLHGQPAMCSGKWKVLQSSTALDARHTPTACCARRCCATTGSSTRASWSACGGSRSRCAAHCPAHLGSGSAGLSTACTAGARDRERQRVRCGCGELHGVAPGGQAGGRGAGHAQAHAGGCAVKLAESLLQRGCTVKLAGRFCHSFVLACLVQRTAHDCTAEPADLTAVRPSPLYPIPHPRKAKGIGLARGACARGHRFASPETPWPAAKRGLLSRSRNRTERRVPLCSRSGTLTALQTQPASGHA